MSEGEAQGLDDLMAKMTACEIERQQTDQPMRHIVPLLCVHYALSTLFLPSYSCYSSFLAHYTPYMLLHLFFSCFTVTPTTLRFFQTIFSSQLHSAVFLLSFSTTPVPCFLWMVHSSLHPFSIHPNDPVSFQAELLLLDGTSAHWRHTPLSPPALSVYGVSPFCGEPSSYSPVMIGVLVTLCICSVIQDILISQKIALSLMSITLIATHHCCHASQYFVTLRAFSFLHHLTVATIALPRKVRKVIEKCFIQNWMRCFQSKKKKISKT